LRYGKGDISILVSSGIRCLARVAVLVVGLIQVGCVGIGGEEIRLEHDSLRSSVPSTPSSFVSLVEPAEDRRDDRSRIGRATVTLFAITSGSVQTQKIVGEEVSRNVASALRAAGYRVVTGDRDELLKEKGAPASTPAIVVKIHELYFKNYNWIWPFVPTWGDVRLSLEVWTPGKGRTYQTTVSGSGRSYRLTGHSAFSKAARTAMTEALNELVGAATTESFRSAAAWSPEEEPARRQERDKRGAPLNSQEKLLELKGLLEDGLISEGEFERARQEILEDL
jgi:hypothetical protein